MATPMTPSSWSSISWILDSSFCQRARCFSAEGAGDSEGVCARAAVRSRRIQKQIFRNEISLAIDLGLPQMLDGSLGTHRRIINFLEGVGAGLGGDDRHDLDVPVIVVVDGLPIAQSL